jgi:2'-hydroxyisoflavone reductase
MRLLVLGGTAFLGRALVEAALARGDDVTIFTRGRTNPDLFSKVERRTGDRDGDLASLDHGEWDAVVDTSGYVPRVVRASCELLAQRVGRYAFISSVSVYADLSRGPDEAAPLATLDDPESEDVGQHYGALKALCEAEVVGAFGDRASIVRPGLIVGPHDPTGRFTYWPHRFAAGGEVLTPTLERQVQLIDVRDLAAWLLALLDANRSGVYNAVGTWAFGDVAAACAAAAANGATPAEVDDAFLIEQSVGEWMELPLWLSSPEYAGMLDADSSAAVAAGLAFRPLEETARGTLDEARTVEGVGLTQERERELLDAWRSR